MRKIILILFALGALTLGIAGCTGKEKEDKTESSIQYTIENNSVLNKDVYVYQNHLYSVFEGSLSWNEAEYYCETLGGHLATITSKEEQTVVSDYVKKSSVNCWIGAYRTKENVLKWVTDEAFEYSYWNSGEPSGSYNGAREDYIGIYADSSKIGRWNDFYMQTNTIQGFVCEWESHDIVGYPNYYYTQIIDSVSDLTMLSNSENIFILSTDIDLSSETNWTPIEGFSGTLIGNGHCISNLNIDAVNMKNIGLFGTLNGTVKDLAIEDVNITASGDAGYAGAVAGTNNGIIENVTVSGVVNPEYYNYVGGLVGWNNCGKLINCTNNANVSGMDSVGGIAGSSTVNVDYALSGCVNEGEINGRDNVGGIAGYLTCVRSNATYYISDNTNKNIVTGSNRVGGIFGEVYAFYQRYNYNDYNSYFSMSVLLNEGKITGSDKCNDAGGLIGKATRLTNLTASKNHADISGGICVGGFVGYAPDTNINAAGEENVNTIIGNGKVGGFAGQAAVIENAINSGTIISLSAFYEDDINKGCVGGIAGECDGIINCTNYSDIVVEHSGLYIGGLAGYIVVSASNRVNNNQNYGTVDGYKYVGGIAGYVTCVRSNATYAISNNCNYNSVNGESHVGGIFGRVYAFYQRYNYNDYNSYFSVSVLKNEGEVVCNQLNDYAGGLIGSAQRISVMTTCENIADVTGGQYVGGLVGYAPDTNIKATGFTNNNTITGSCYVGGLAGYAGVIEYGNNFGEVIATVANSDGNIYLGGIAGYCKGIIGCVNNADISVNNGGDCVGGIAGYVYLTNTNTVYDNINYGQISGNDYVGGIFGYATCTRSNATYKVTANENKNTVVGSKYVGGIAGYVYGFYERYNYNDYNSYFEIVNCTNEAEIVGEEWFGGICGGNSRLKTEEVLINTNTTSYGTILGTAKE